MASRAQTPPVNLKERIAALQQRNVSPNQHPSTQVASKGIPIAGTGTLRDKIAKFEEKGGVPVPRGSFAMGVPSTLTENAAAAKKRGELYGNRIQGLGRPNGPPVSRSGSPMPLDGNAPNPRKRCISTGGALSSPLTTCISGDAVPPPLPNGATLPVPRRNSLAVNFSLGRRAVSAGCEGPSDGLDSPSSSPLPHPSPAEEPDSVIAAAVDTPHTPPSLPPESSEVSVSAEPATPSQEEDAEESTAEEEFVSFETEPEQSIRPDESTPTPDMDTALSDDKSTSEVASPDTKSKSDAILLHRETSSAMGETAVENGLLSDGSVVTQSTPAVPQSIPSIEPVTMPPADPVPRSLSSAATNEEANTVSSFAAESIPAAPVSASHSENQPVKAAPVIAAGSEGQDKACPPSPDLKPKVAPSMEKKTTFKAVVHRKVTGPPAATAPASSLAAPPTSPVPKVRRSAVTTVTPSLSNQAPGELTILLEEAALLELKLTGGDASESLDPSSLKTPTSATFQSDPRSESAITLTERKPVPPLPDTDFFSRLSLSIPAIREPTLESEIPEIPEEDETSDGKSLASTTFSQRSPSHRKYLSSFRRLTNRRSATNMPGAYPRDSISLSSEDSAPVATPPDTGNGRNGGFGIAWPSVSPKVEREQCQRCRNRS
ncbi:hypothetical protein EDD15DRAFT_637296 [Pisolithus albus]|nr:hypothetical protein EDD15DRAFT_637296 [Pisolithus albus]